MGSFEIMYQAPVNLFDEPYQRLQRYLTNATYIGS
jgi:hypothetical protein